MTRLIKLPSGGDTSYPGMVWHNNMLYISYYSSHEAKTNIYLAKVKILPKPTVVIENTKDGIVIRLVGEGDNGIWRLKDVQNDIEIKRLDNGVIAIKASITTIPDGGITKIDTRLKMVPGKTIALTGMGNKRISLECPEEKFKS